MERFLGRALAAAARRLGPGLPFLPLMGLLALSLAATGCAPAQTSAEPAESRVPVRVVVAREAKLAVTTTATGQVRPRLEVRISSKVPGRVAEVLVNLGDTVEKGDLLVQLEDREARLQVEQARAAVAQARAQAAEANRNLERVEKLFAGGAVSRQQVDQATTGAQLARGQLQAAEAALALAQTNLDNTRVLAPARGVISRRSVEPGALISLGVTLFELVDVSEVAVEAGVAEQDVNRVRAGQEVAVRIPALERPFSGTVAGISPAADPRTGLFTIRVTVANPEGVLRGGMFAEVELATREATGIVVPVDALLERSGAYRLFVVENGSAWERLVEVQFRSGDQALVTGIPAGSQVVVAGQNQLLNGAPVQVVAEEAGS